MTTPQLTQREKVLLDMVRTLAGAIKTYEADGYIPSDIHAMFAMNVPDGDDVEVSQFIDECVNTVK